MAFSVPVLASPPPWAPAHGHYKSKPAPRDYDRRYYPDRRDYRDRHRSDLLPWLAGAAATGYLVGNRCNREALGSVLGGIIGGVTGSQIGRGDGRRAATIAGALIGLLIGKSIGRQMDQVDQYCTGQTLEYARDRQPITWYNPDNRTQYSVTPTSTYQTESGRYCREYVTQAALGGRGQQVYGTACRQPDGSWQIMD